MAIDTTCNLSDAPLVSILSADPDMLELVEMFVDDAPKKVALLASLIEQENWAGVRQFAHQLKGSAAGYGFPSVTEAAGHLELLLVAKADTQRINASALEVMQLLQRIRLA